MKITVIIYFVLAFSAPILQASPSHAQVMKKKVTVNYQGKTLQYILMDLRHQANVDFTYTKELSLDKHIVKDIHFENKSLEEILGSLFRSRDITFSEVGGAITLSRKQKPGRITGKITDGQGQSLPGASVRITELGQSTSADANGDFTISVPPGTYTIEVSYLSYETQQKVGVIVGEQQNVVVNFSLQGAEGTLNEVVVVGYGTQVRSKVTGAISQVKSNELNQYASSGFAQQLAGRVAGVMINESTGMPGTDPQIIIRGISTLTAGTKPLVVVDGFPLTEGTSFNSINPNDIETIDILKDPASASIYGSRAANGVILITTKNPKGDKLSVNFDFYTGFQQRSDKLKLIDAYQTALYTTEARDQAYVAKDPTNRSIEDDQATRISKGASKRDLRLHYVDPYLNNDPGLVNTNWLDEIFRTAPINNYTLSISGKTGTSTNYYVSANFLDQKGIVLGSDLKRYSGNIKINSKVSNRLNFGINLTPSFTDRGYHNDVIDALRAYPFFTAYNDDGTLSIGQQLAANTPEDGALSENPIALTEKQVKQRSDFRTFGNTFLEFKILDGLTAKTMLGGDYTNSFDDFFDPSDVGGYRTLAPKPASAAETQGNSWNYLTENTLTYAKSFHKHNVNFLAGYSYQKESSKSTKVTGTGIPDNNLENIAGASNYSVSANRYTWTQVSYWSRLQYDYMGKYLLSATIRRDGSSRFGKDSKWGNFPSVSAGWVISDESFFSKEETKIDFLKFRASWGMAGNNQIGSYGSQALLSKADYVNGNVLAPGYYASSAPNPLLSWETQTATNFGLDMTFLKRFDFSLNYYNTKTSDLLLDVPVPAQSGYTSSLQNIGAIRNKGFEFSFGANSINLGAVKWSFSANLSTNKNMVLNLAEGQDQIISGNFRTKVGGPVAEFYGYNILGIYKSQEEIDATPHIGGTQVGDNIVEDANHDGTITTDDRVGLGTYAPKISYGFQSSFLYKNLELSFGLNGVEGRTVYDGNLAGEENGEAFIISTEYYFKNRFHPVDNPNGFLPQPTTNFSQNRLQTGWASSRYNYDADFLRVRFIRLTYDLPSSVLSKLKVSGLKLYVAANNPFTFTSFRGLNPEGTSDNVLQSGTAGSNYPVAKSYTIGANLSF